MEINWLGHSSFKIRGKEVTVVTDPFDQGMVGFKFPKTEAQVVTISHSHADHNRADVVDGDPFVIDSPGEYEIKGVSVFGVGTFHDNTSGSERGANTVFVIEIDGVKICHLGDLGHKLTEEQIEEINTVDVLLVPTGGYYTLGPKEAVGVVAQIEPSIIIPMHFKVDGLIAGLAEKLAGVDGFLKEMGITRQDLPKLVVTPDKIPEETQVVVLERKV